MSIMLYICQININNDIICLLKAPINILRYELFLVDDEA